MAAELLGGDRCGLWGRARGALGARYRIACAIYTMRLVLAPSTARRVLVGRRAGAGQTGGGDSVNILMVDSDRDTVEMVTTWLRSHGETVHFCYTPDKAREAWLARKPELVITDVGFPDLDIVAMFNDLRVQHDALILATSDEPSAQLEAYCLESGADAFVAKPFMPKLLRAYIHALSRRMRSTVQRQPASVFTVGPIRFDASRNEVRVNGRVEHLTPTESRILHVLAINAGDVCSQSQIVAHAWGYGEDGDTYLIKAHIRNLRKRIEPVPSRPRYIRTVPGVGYTLSAGTALDDAGDDAEAEYSERASNAWEARGRDMEDAPDAEDDDVDEDGAEERDPLEQMGVRASARRIAEGGARAELGGPRRGPLGPEAFNGH